HDQGGLVNEAQELFEHEIEVPASPRVFTMTSLMCPTCTPPQSEQRPPSSDAANRSASSRSTLQSPRMYFRAPSTEKVAQSGEDVPPAADWARTLLSSCQPSHEPGHEPCQAGVGGDLARPAGRAAEFGQHPPRPPQQFILPVTAEVNGLQSPPTGLLGAVTQDPQLAAAVLLRDDHASRLQEWSRSLDPLFHPLPPGIQHGGTR